MTTKDKAKAKRTAKTGGMIQPPSAGTFLKLTLKQQKFVDHYNLYGHGTDAARAAGYKGNDATLSAVAVENLQKPLIAQAIQKQREQVQALAIATKAERHAFLTDVMRAKADGDFEGPSYSERLKACELLCKIDGEFIDKKQIEGDVIVRVVRGDHAPSAIGHKPGNEDH